MFSSRHIEHDQALAADLGAGGFEPVLVGGLEMGKRPDTAAVASWARSYSV
jgi:hypothetical protein